MIKSYTPTLLLVEDDADDVFIFNRALKQAQVTYPVQVMHDAEAAMDYLSGTDGFANRDTFPLPTAVFLDLKLPRVSGLEFLQWLRQQAHLDSIAVVVLTSSAEERDISQAYRLGARSYLVKPPNPASLGAILNAIQSSWNAGSSHLPIPGEQIPKSAGAPKNDFES